MFRFLLASLLLLGSLRPALAQRVINQSAALAAGQGVYLDLKHATTIRVRPAAAGQALAVTARVSINNNQLNDALSLALSTAAGELSVVENLDKQALRAANYPGPCSGGQENSSSWDDPGHRQYHYCLRADYEVMLPAGTALRIGTVSGDVDVSGLSGALTVKTISGNLLLDGVTGPLTARSVSGDIKLTHPGAQPVEAASVSGNVDLSWPLAQSADLNLKTISGEVYADPAVAFANRREHSVVGYALKGSLGAAGGPLVKLESVSGNVFFRPQK